MRAQTVGTVLIGLLVAATASADQIPSPTMPSARALRFFERLSPEVDKVLRLLRPTAISPGTRRRVLASLPPEGTLRPDANEAAKLASLETVLVYHERHHVFETKVIDVPQAAFGLHGRAILLISRSALRLLSSTDVVALVAHEVGHEYFWDEYQAASIRRDAATLQEVELKCDGIAVLTLIALGLDPATLDGASRKLTRFNGERGATANVGEYPGLAERAWFLRRMIEMRSDRKR
jgi:hypothetical protein